MSNLHFPYFLVVVRTLKVWTSMSFQCGGMRGDEEGTTRCCRVFVVRVWTMTTGGWAGGIVAGCWLMTLPVLLLAAAAATITTGDDGVVDEMTAGIVVVVVDGLGKAGRPAVVPEKSTFPV